MPVCDEGKRLHMRIDDARHRLPLRLAELRVRRGDRRHRAVMLADLNARIGAVDARRIPVVLEGGGDALRRLFSVSTRLHAAENFFDA